MKRVALVLAALLAVSSPGWAAIQLQTNEIGLCLPSITLGGCLPNPWQQCGLPCNNAQVTSDITVVSNGMMTGTCGFVGFETQTMMSSHIGMPGPVCMPQISMHTLATLGNFGNVLLTIDLP
jgi:hypothetical protein